VKNAKINLNKLSAMLIILLIAGFIAPLSTTMASNGNGSSQGEQIVIANNSTSTPSINSDSNQGANTSTSTPNISSNSTNAPNI
jgi:galactitol-specific phosphotransferase system IIC component